MKSYNHYELQFPEVTVVKRQTVTGKCINSKEYRKYLKLKKLRETCIFDAWVIDMQDEFCELGEVAFSVYFNHAFESCYQVYDNVPIKMREMVDLLVTGETK